jgi:hypothetical protein
MQKVTVEPWQFVSSQLKLSVEFGVSRMKIIRMLSVLQDMKIVNTKWYTKYSLFTVVNRKTYQETNIKWTSNEHQANTNNNDKEWEEWKRNSGNVSDWKSTIDLEDFVDKWNSIKLKKLKKQLPKTIKITEKIKKERARVTKEYTIEEIKLWVNNYCKYLVSMRSDKWTYKDHRFTLYFFLKRDWWLSNFINYQP